MFFRAALLIAGAGLAVAQDFSSQCTSALLSVASSPDAACLDLSLLAPLALSNSSATSIIPTINTWLNGMCGQAPCSNATLQAVVTNITSGCSSDLASFGFGDTNTSSIVKAVQKGYPSAREVACLKDTSKNTLCATELLNDVQAATTTITFNNIFGMLSNSTTGIIVNVPQNVTCSNCSKAAYTIIAQDFPEFVSSEKSYYESQCGSSFTDGKMPSGIQETSSSTSSTGGASSLSISSFRAGVSVLIVVSSAFAIFA